MSPYIDLIQIQQYYEKQGMLRRGHIQEREGKRRSEEGKYG
jgi:hypothetical protein